ncbi:FAD synthase [Drosophila albomicans]|uniref:FAD synthase n=1 Tax=Drosophila albomicans TaxID=7291 RepID=A0A6P8W565_DROAB|nr:FAD synthase [Drosophila albomicans]
MPLLHYCCRVWPRAVALQRCCHTLPTQNLKSIDEALVKGKLLQTEAILKQATTLYKPDEVMLQFIATTLQRYSVKLQRYNGPLKLAVEQALAEQPQVRAMFLGCRRTDPGCAELTPMMPCDNGWPVLMRIFPLLDWSYHDVWNYLRSRQLPYCSLYDQGYTSLGERSSTRMNPSLLAYDEQLGKLIYRPAYELKDDKLERANREDTQLVNRTRQHHQNP